MDMNKTKIISIIILVENTDGSRFIRRLDKKDAEVWKDEVDRRLAHYAEITKDNFPQFDWKIEGG